MNPIRKFETCLPENARATFHDLDTPRAVQDYLDSLPYVAEELDRSPLRVMTDGQCHCLDGGLFAALALWRIGFRPLVLDLVPAPGMDDDHVLALFQVDGGWGAVAKSNYTGLGYREPVYRNLRELAMSYFEDYYNFEGKRSLRGYTRPLDLSPFDATGWMWDEAGVKVVSKRLYGRKSISMISEAAAARLTKASERAFKAASLYTNFDWVYGVRSDH